MTKINILSMVKCPMLIEFEPTDLVPTSTCLGCAHISFISTFVECKFGEE